MSGHPTDIGRTPKHVFVFHVEDPLRRDVGAGHVSACCVHHTFRLSRCAAGIEHEQRVLGIQRLDRKLIGRAGHHFLPPHIASWNHVDGVPGPLVNNDFLDTRSSCQRIVCILLQRHDRSSTISSVCRNQHSRLRVIDSIPERLRAESSKHDVVCDAHARTSEHGHGKFRHHTHVDRRAVTFLEAERLQDVRETAHFLVKHRVTQRADVARFAFPKDCDLVFPGWIAQMPIKAIVGKIRLSTHEPLGERRVPFEHLSPGLEPVQFRRDIGPETFRIIERALRNGVIHLEAVNVCVPGKFGTRREYSLLLEQGFDICFSHRNSLKEARSREARSQNELFLILASGFSASGFFVLFTSISRSVRNSSGCTDSIAPERYLRER